MAINTQKLLPSAQTSASIVKYAGLTSDNGNGDGKLVKNKIPEIKVKVIDISKVLKGTLALEKNKLDKKKESDKKEDRKKEEKRLETKLKKKGDKKKRPKIPGTGIFDWIKNFISNVILGYFAYRLVDHLPKLLGFVKIIAPATEFLINLGGKLLNGLVTFIDWGYKAYDATKGFMKNLFGDDGAKKFDQLAGLLNQFLNLALIVGMATSGPGIGDKPRRRGGGRIRGDITDKGFFNKKTGRWQGSFSAKNGSYRTEEAARRYARRFGRDAATRRFGKKGVEYLGGKYARSGATNLARRGAAAVLGKTGLKTAARVIKPIVGRIPLIGGLLEFGISWAVGDPIGKAAFRGIGAILVGAVGTAIGGPIGAAIGGFVGGEVGGALYDMFFENKKPSKNKKTQGRAEGGQITRGGERISGARRRLKKRKVTRIAPQKPTKEKVELPKESRAKFLGIDVEDPYVKNTAEIGTELGKVDYFGPILSTTSKVLLGEKPTQKDYENVGRGINLLLYNGFNKEELAGGIVAAFAEGGMVNKSIMDMEGSVKVSNWVSDTFKKSLETELQTAIRKIEKTQKKPKKEKGPQPPPDSATGYSGTGLAGGAVAPSELYKEIGADLEQWNIYRNSVALIESNGNYSIPGGSGMHYDGRYQMGAAAKKDGSRVAGVDYPGHSDDPNASVRVNYRNNPELQETIFTGFTVANHRYLMRNPKYKTASVERKLEVLGYAHNQGMGGAENWLNTGQVGADGFGTKGTAYTDLIKKNFLAKRKGQELEVAGGAIDVPSEPIPGCSLPSTGVVNDREWNTGIELSTIKTKSGRSFQVARILSKQFQGFINDLEATGYQINSIGGYRKAGTGGGTGPADPDYDKERYSHPYGASIDINPGKNPYGSKLVTDMPSNISEIAAKHGLGWGGNWSSVKDAMHFSAMSREGGNRNWNLFRKGGPAFKKMEMGGPIGSKYNSSLLKTYASYESGSEESITVVVPNQTSSTEQVIVGNQMLPIPIVLGSGGDPFEFLDYQG